MKYTFGFIMILLFFLSSCSTEGVRMAENSAQQGIIDSSSSSIEKVDELVVVDSVKSVEKRLKNGLKLVWENQIEADRLEVGDVVKLDFVGRTSDGKIFDSSRKINKLIPTRIGWGMLIEGWDLGLQEMAVGEKAKMFIPYHLAYGDEGDYRKIGPKTDLIIDVEVKEKLTPMFDSAGIKVYLVEEFLKGENPKAVKGADKLMFDYWSFTDEGKRYDSSYEKGHAFVHHIGDKNLNFGLRKGLEQLKEGQSAYIHVPAEHGFGKKGLKGVIKPNQDLMFIVTIKKVE